MSDNKSKYCHDHRDENGNWVRPKADCPYCRIEGLERDVERLRNKLERVHYVAMESSEKSRSSQELAITINKMRSMAEPESA